MVVVATLMPTHIIKDFLSARDLSQHFRVVDATLKLQSMTICCSGCGTIE